MTKIMSISLVENCDNMDFMGRYPDNYFDLAIVDPPYGIGEDGRKNHTRSKMATANNYQQYSKYDCCTPDNKYFKELFRVSKNQIIWGGNYFIEHLKSTSCIIVWDKQNGENDFADFEMAWTSFTTAARFIRFRSQGMLQGNMKDKEVRIHPNQKFRAIYDLLLRKYAKLGDKILDTHLGSGSSRLAAYDLGFDFYACELDKEYFDAQEKRFAKHISQTKLFTPSQQVSQQMGIGL